MKQKGTIAYLILVVLSVFATGATSQHSQHHSPQITQENDSKGESAKSQGMMTGRMMAHHKEMESLVEQLLDSFAALERETNPAAVKNKLAAHAALLEQLQSKITQRSEMMPKMMDHMMNCPMMQGEQRLD